MSMARSPTASARSASSSLLRSTGKGDELAALGRQLAMHVAATNPVALDLASVTPEVLEREKSPILAEKNARQPGILAKITSGLKSYAKEYCLLEQAYIHDGSKSVSQVLKEIEGKVDAPVKLTGFARFALGEASRRKSRTSRRRSLPPAAPRADKLCQSIFERSGYRFA